MTFRYRTIYLTLSDQQLVDRILADKPDEEAAAYLLYERYAHHLMKEYSRLTDDTTWFKDCVDELFMLLKGKDGSWHAFARFKWQSTLGYWLKKVARNEFRKSLPKLIENSGRNISINSTRPEGPKLELSDKRGETAEARLQRILLMEAIAKLKDADERFVTLKRLQGYTSKEIAVLLDKKWKEQNIVKYNHDGELVVVNDKYVDSKAQKARRHLKRIMVESK